MTYISNASEFILGQHYRLLSRSEQDERKQVKLYKAITLEDITVRIDFSKIDTHLCLVCSQWMRDWVIIYSDRIIIKKGYAWDLNSGPHVPDDIGILASLVHDAIFQFSGDKNWPHDKISRCDANKIYFKLCEKPAAYIYYAALCLFSQFYWGKYYHGLLVRWERANK